MLYPYMTAKDYANWNLIKRLLSHKEYEVIHKFGDSESGWMRLSYKDRTEVLNYSTPYSQAYNILERFLAFYLQFHKFRSHE